MNTMKNKRLYLLILLSVFLLSVTAAGAQDIPGFRSRIYSSYAKGDMSDWKNVITEMEKLHEEAGSSELLHELLMARYGYIGFCINENKKREASRHLDKAQKNLEILLAGKPGNATLMALEGALMGYEMGLNKLKAVVIGPKAKEKIDAAVEKDPEAIRTLLEKGNQLNFSPKLVGGDTEKAIDYYNRAIKKIESRPAELKNNWVYVNSLVVLAAAYEKTDNYDPACRIYEKIMDYDPGIKWVKNDLYPTCREKIRE